MKHVRSLSCLAVTAQIALSKSPTCRFAGDAVVEDYVGSCLVFEELSEKTKIVTA